MWGFEPGGPVRVSCKGERGATCSITNRPELNGDSWRTTLFVTAFYGVSRNIRPVGCLRCVFGASERCPVWEVSFHAPPTLMNEA